MSEEKIILAPGLEIRYTQPTDGPYLRTWLEEPGVLRWFPMMDGVELEDSIQRWISFSRYRCSLTAVMNGTPCGIITLWLQPYKKLAHQCEFGIIVDNNFRNLGIGATLIKSMEYLAKETFKIELLHLQVYSDNPAKRLYERLGYVEFGYQEKWIKETDGEYVGRTFMEKSLID